MEWVLQVVDEIDDAIGVLRFRWLGLMARLGVLRSSLAALAAVPAHDLVRMRRGDARPAAARR
jgi:hypothetical protein